MVSKLRFDVTQLNTINKVTKICIIDGDSMRSLSRTTSENNRKTFAKCQCFIKNVHLHYMEIHNICKNYGFTGHFIKWNVIILAQYLWNWFATRGLYATEENILRNYIFIKISHVSIYTFLWRWQNGPTAKANEVRAVRGARMRGEDRGNVGIPPIEGGKGTFRRLVVV